MKHLTWLLTCRYAETVIYRIFYNLDKTGSGRLTRREIKRSVLDYTAHAFEWRILEITWTSFSLYFHLMVLLFPYWFCQVYTFFADRSHVVLGFFAPRDWSLLSLILGGCSCCHSLAGKVSFAEWVTADRMALPDLTISAHKAQRAC